MQYNDHFKGKCCVVTGAASGIGLALTEELLKAGAVVFMADFNEKLLSEASDKLKTYGKSIHTVTVDVTNQEQVQKLIESAASTHGGIDFLFNNAGIGATGLIEDVTMEQWRRIIDVNLWGVIYGIMAALPIMRKQHSGHIITTSSIAGLMPFPLQALYCTTKYAVVGMSESLRHELKSEDIRFSVVCPGEVATRIWGTPIIGEAREVKPPENSITAEEAATTILKGIVDNTGIITLPERSRILWRQYWNSPESFEDFMQDMANQRKESKPWKALNK